MSEDQNSSSRNTGNHQCADAGPSPRSLQKGPVRGLCDEIGFDFDARLERPDVFVAFVRELVNEVRDQRQTLAAIGNLTGKPPSDASAEVLALAYEMLDAPCRSRIAKAGDVHDAADRLSPDDAYPTDHLIDMLSSCASAIRFGLETPCLSRHAADAAQHVFKQVYGVSRFDRNTPRWEKDWARTKFMAAVIGLLRDGGEAVHEQVHQPIRDEPPSPPQALATREGETPAPPAGAKP